MMLLGYLIPTRAVQTVLTAVGLVVAFFAWLHVHDAKVVTNEKVRVEQQGAKTNAKAHAARAAVPPSGSVERLRASNCRDC